MEILLFLFLGAMCLGAFYGFWWLTVKMSLWTIEPLIKWLEERQRQ